MKATINIVKYLEKHVTDSYLLQNTKSIMTLVLCNPLNFTKLLTQYVREQEGKIGIEIVNYTKDDFMKDIFLARSIEFQIKYPLVTQVYYVSGKKVRQGFVNHLKELGIVLETKNELTHVERYITLF